MIAPFVPAYAACSRARDPMDRGDVADRAFASFNHSGHERLGEKKCGAYVDIVNFFKLARLHFEERFVKGDPGIVDQHIQVPVRIVDGPRDGLAFFLRGDVETKGGGPPAMGDDALFGGFGGIRIQIGAVNESAGDRKSFRDGAAETGSRTGDQGDFVVKVRHMMSVD